MSRIKNTYRTFDLRALLSLTPDILLLIKQIQGEWRIQFSNRAVRRLGYLENNLYGKPFWHIFDPSYQQVLIQTLKAFRGREMRLQIPVRLRTASGEPVGGNLGMILLRDGQEARGYIILAVRSRQSVIEQILNGVDIGILLVDRNGRIRYANRYARSLFGESLTLPDVLLNLPPKEEAQNIIWNDRFLGVTVYPAGTSRNQERLFLIKDITEKKWVQETLIRLDRFSSFGVLASGLAHEIKNPLAGMRLIAQNLSRRMENPRDQEALRRMLRQIDRIDSLVKQFFSYVKPKDPHPEKVPLKEVMEDIYPLIKDRLNKQRIRFEQSIPDEITVLADRQQLEQIFLNLVLNAMDAMPQRGTLRIEAREVHQKFPRLEGEHWVEISVQDTGVGMDPDQLEHIFVPFFTTKPSGTGLGLFIVHQLVTRNGGLIRVESMKNRGTRFILYLKPG